MVFVYGGITWWDALSLIFCYVAVAFMAGSLGIFFSSVFRRSTVSTAVTYGTLIAFCGRNVFYQPFCPLDVCCESRPDHSGICDGGACHPCFFRRRFLSLFDESGLYLYGSHWKSGRAQHLLCQLCSYFGMENTGFVMEHWVLLSVLLQLAAGALLLWEAVQFLEPVKKKEKKKIRG